MGTHADDSNTGNKHDGSNGNAIFGGDGEDADDLEKSGEVLRNLVVHLADV